MPTKKIALILGHPDRDSFCGAIADTYVQNAQAAGHEVRSFYLGELEFDPILRHGYRQRQTLEPALEQVQQALSWAEHVVLVYPVWWGSMPALLKGLLDRVLLPGFAFKYRQNSSLWDKLLSGRTGQAFITMDTPRWFFRWVYKMPAHHQLKKTILEFCGFQPVRIDTFAPLRDADDGKRQQWLTQVAQRAKQLN